MTNIAKHTKHFKRTMAKRRRKRLAMIVIGLVILAFVVGLVLYALGDKASFFRTPSEITTKDIQTQRSLQLGGYVENGSVVRQQGTTVRFNVTDYTKAQLVTFTGILPDLFREGQGVIVEGQFGGDGIFHASRVLAKHDENYVPKTVVDSLKQQGVWEGDRDNVN